MPAHPLAREIIATAVTNSMINRMGPVFALRIEEDSGADIAAIARAYTISREVLNVRKLWISIEALDNDVHANVQYSMMFQTTRLLKHATTWFLTRHGDNLNIDESVSRLKPEVSNIRKDLHRKLVGGERERFDEAVHLYEDIGVPTSVARRMAGLNTMYSILDIVEIAQEHDRDAHMVAGLYFQVGHGLKLDWIRDQIENLQVEGRWQAVARGTLRENLFSLHRELTSQLVHITGDQDSAGDLVLDWLGGHKAQVNHFMRTMQDMRAAGAMDFPTLSVALQEIRKLTLK
jgi:glutamate dehydrogenase